MHYRCMQKSSHRALKSCKSRSDGMNPRRRTSTAPFQSTTPMEINILFSRSANQCRVSEPRGAATAPTKNCQTVKFIDAQSRSLGVLSISLSSSASVGVPFAAPAGHSSCRNIRMAQLSGCRYKLPAPGSVYRVACTDDIDGRMELMVASDTVGCVWKALRECLS